MITLHKTEIARQNNTLSIYFQTLKISQIMFQGSQVLLRGAELPRSSHPVISNQVLVSPL